MNFVFALAAALPLVAVGAFDYDDARAHPFVFPLEGDHITRKQSSFKNSQMKTSNLEEFVSTTSLREFMRLKESVSRRTSSVTNKHSKKRSAVDVQPQAVETRTVTNPEEFVDMSFGTRNTEEMSRGNSLPLVGRPWGFNYWAPRTNLRVNEWGDSSSWWFHPDDFRLYGIRCTHQPSPWIGDWGSFHVGMGMGNAWSYNIGYDSANALFRPYHFSGELWGAGDTTQGSINVTATSHAMISEWYFPYGPETIEGTYYGRFRQLHVVVEPGLMELWKDGDDFVSGESQQKPGEGTGMDFHHHFKIQFSETPYETCMFGTGGCMDTAPTEPEKLTYRFRFADTVEHLTVRVATSLISKEQVLVNMGQVLGREFPEVYEESKQVWNDHLSVVDLTDVGSTSEEEVQAARQIFYSVLAKTMLFPRDLGERNSTGLFHYNAMAKEEPYVRPGFYSTDSGFWDAAHTVYPLLTLLFPDRLGQIITGYLNAYDAGGWVPQWSAPAERASMVSTMSDVSFSDAIVKNMTGFDQEKAWATIKKHCYEQTPADWINVGRRGLDIYIEKGYIPGDYPDPNPGEEEFLTEEVARSLNYYAADWASSQAASKLEKPEASELLERSKNYTKLFDTDTMFFRRKFTGGTWDPDFDPLNWAGGTLGPYTEGSAWSYRYYTPHDAAGLAELYGGPEKFCEALDDLTVGTPNYHKGVYGNPSHEQFEVMHCMYSLYGHNNQPSHPFLYMYGAAAGSNSSLHEACVKHGQFHIRKTLVESYYNGGYCGDEDNGEMSSWYVLSSLGLYEMMPGTTWWNVGAPLYAKATVRPYNRTTTLVVNANGNGPSECPYASGFTFDGAPNSDWTLEHSKLVQGGTLEFAMETCGTSVGGAVSSSFSAMVLGTAAALFLILT